MGIYFKVGVTNPGILAGGLLSAMVGLVLFVDGLRVAIMPLGSMLGQQLPEHFKVRYILIVACAIGILCTYAEPAIASLRPLAGLVKRCQTPYLYFVLNDMSEVLVLSIGLGVGVAAMIGVLRFLRGWSLKPLIAMRYVVSHSGHRCSEIQKIGEGTRHRKMTVGETRNSTAMQMHPIAM